MSCERLPSHHECVADLDSKQRLEDEYDSNVIVTAPTVPYKGESTYISSPLRPLIYSSDTRWQRDSHLKSGRLSRCDRPESPCLGCGGTDGSVRRTSVVVTIAHILQSMPRSLCRTVGKASIVAVSGTRAEHDRVYRRDDGSVFPLSGCTTGVQGPRELRSGNHEVQAAPCWSVIQSLVFECRD